MTRSAAYGTGRLSGSLVYVSVGISKDVSLLSRCRYLCFAYMHMSLIAASVGFFDSS